MISKIIFLKNKKKHHFDAFRNEKHFEKQPQPHSQTGEKKKANPGEPSKLRLIFQICNLWNPRLELNHEDQSPTNLILMDEIGKKYQFEKFVKIKKSNKI